MNIVDPVVHNFAGSGIGVDEMLLCTEPFPLPTEIRSKLEVLFVADFSAVRVFIDYLPQDYDALAYAQGNEIHIVPGFYNPDTCAGVWLLAHELAHLVQQAQGRTETPFGDNLRVIDSHLEAEADEAADYCVYAICGQPGAAGSVMPDALTKGCRIEGSKKYLHQPIQCVPITSAQSYQQFRTDCYIYLSGFNGTAINAMNHQARINHIYNNFYANYNGHNIVLPAKAPLAGQALYQAMDDILTATTAAHHNNDIRIQQGGAPWIQLYGDAAKNPLIAEYQAAVAALAAAPPLPVPALSANATQAMNNYLHIYPNPRRAVNNNWRLAVNLPAGEIAAAVAALMPVMQAHANIDHIKFAAPTMVNKPDSVIVYMERDAAYAATEAAVRGAVVTPPGFNVVQQMNPMLNEISEGYAECAEAPVHGGSFGSFRCVLAYQAYLTMRKQYCQIRWGQGNYNTVLDALFTRLGIPAPANPHQQNALLPQPHFSVRAAIFRGLNDARSGRTLLGNR